MGFNELDKKCDFVHTDRGEGKRKMQMELLRSLCERSAIKWSVHCLERMQERDISRADVKHCILSGEIIEDYPEDFPYPSCLILGFAVNNKMIHVVVGTNEVFLYVITAYFPNIKKFDKDFKTRRGKC